MQCNVIVLTNNIRHLLQSWQKSLWAQSGVSCLVTPMSQQTSLLSSPALTSREWAGL